MTLLEVTGLSKRFGGVQAVQDCSLGVDRGEVVGLIGPNGAGKSTVITLVSGFAVSDEGRVKFDDLDITRQPAHVRARHGLLRTFQLARVWGRLSVMENMLVAGSQSRRESLWRQFAAPRRQMREEALDRERAREILNEYQLLRLKDLPAEQLSGGQKRLLEFARIMMAKPRLVLLDEPSASLSPVMSERIGESILRLVGSGIAVLLVEHDLPLVEATCSRIVCMAGGRIIAEGSMESLRRNELVVEAYLGAAVEERAIAQAGLN
jgi:ABC-type branched-subunit amino acid transport system ATPase component